MLQEDKSNRKHDVSEHSGKDVCDGGGVFILITQAMNKSKLNILLQSKQCKYK